MKWPFELDVGLMGQLRIAAQTVLACSLLVFFVSVVLMGGEIGDPAFAEGVASLASLAIALSGFSYISLGLIAERSPLSSRLVEPDAASRIVRR